MFDNVILVKYLLYTSVLYLCLEKVYNWMRTNALKLIHSGCARGVFHGDVILFKWTAPYVTR